MLPECIIVSKAEPLSCSTQLARPQKSAWKQWVSDILRTHWILSNQYTPHGAEPAGTWTVWLLETWWQNIDKYENNYELWNQKTLQTMLLPIFPYVINITYNKECVCC